MKRIALLIVIFAASITWAENKSAPVFVSWDAHSPGPEIQCPCSEGSDIDPYTGNRKDCKRPSGCHEDFVKQLIEVFPSQEEADKFKVGCSTETCTNWSSRPATHQEIINAYLAEKGWSMGPPSSEMFSTKELCVYEINSENRRLQKGSSIGCAYTDEIAIRTALTFKENHWRLLWLSVSSDPFVDNWGVYPDPNNEITDMPMGSVTDGHGTALSPIASAHHATDAVKKAFKASGIKVQ